MVTSNFASPPRTLAGIVLAVVCALSPVAAMAQVGALQRELGPPQQEKPLEPGRAGGQDRAGPAEAPKQSGSLSQQLDRSGGVIRPPVAVDPKMEKPAPETASQMPVIPPPGSPGGNPNVQPK